MKTAKVNTNKMLFMVLFAALSFDLAGRLQKTDGILSADFASTDGEEQCAGQIRDGVLSSTKQGGCTLTFKEGTTEARVRKVNKVKESSGWNDAAEKVATLEEPVPPKQDKCSFTKKADPKGAKAKACKTKNATALKEYDNEVARVRAHNSRAKAAPVGEELFEIDIETAASDCADCRVVRPYSLAKSASPLEISKFIHAKAKEQVKELSAQKIAADNKAKQDAAKLALETKQAKDKENCLIGDDNKALTAAAQLDCNTAALDTLEGKDARARFAKVQSSLNQMLRSDDKEQRDLALLKSKEIASSSSLPRDVRETARVMHVAGKYNSQIMSVTEAMNKIPANNYAARAQYMSRLSQIGNQMEYELGTAANMYGVNGAVGSPAYDELMSWHASLTGSLTLAISGQGNSILNQDINQYNRTLRGLPGDSLIGTQRGFNNLQLTGNAAIDAALIQQSQIVNGLTGGTKIPGVPGTVVSGATGINGLNNTTPGLVRSNTIPTSGTTVIPGQNGVRASARQVR